MFRTLFWSPSPIMIPVPYPSFSPCSIKAHAVFVQSPDIFTDVVLSLKLEPTNPEAVICLLEPFPKSCSYKVSLQLIYLVITLENLSVSSPPDWSATTTSTSRHEQEHHHHKSQCHGSNDTSPNLLSLVGFQTLDTLGEVCLRIVLKIR